ncbi:uncharacterized protein LOC123311723 [Coccinella septempunctata]|uniref:uncharacterized protein LOC123311723 n=1 Tax=Coccinella septempunctata TaxID=41139 RepID=UPI001D06CDD6|nr:uncharacterized protein LOC123311723 [Coccinella septempunctata]
MKGGRGQRAGPLRSRPEVEPDGVSCGASGAAPRDGTVRPNSHGRERRSISLDKIRTRPAEVSSTRDGKVRWTQEENILLMRTHFIAQQQQHDTGGNYRELLTTIWNEINPEKQSYPNLLVNRVRLFLQNERFSTVELEAIKKSIRPHTPNPAENTDVDNEEAYAEHPMEPTPQWCQTNKIFQKNMKMYARVSTQDRPKIPRLKGSRKILESVERANTVIKSSIRSDSTIADFVDSVYAGAITVCEKNGIRLYSRQTKPREEKMPPWKTRLEKKINNIRKIIGTLHTYLNNNSPTRKIVKRVTSQHHIKARDEQLRQQLIILCDTLKQKIKALGNRIRRYNERVKRYKNSQLYYKNPKQFHRSLEGTVTVNKSYPTPENIHATWKEIWAHAGDHDD